ncbi:MAG: hypothetical protein ACREHG_11235, partial [Candidatus Saccharimonadales bacterium]
MPVGTSDGEYFESPIEQFQAENASKIGINSYLSRSGQGDADSDDADRMPHNAPEKLTGKGKSHGDIWDTLRQTWPARLGEALYSSAKDLITAPHDAYFNGMSEDEMIKRSANAAMALSEGGLATAPMKEGLAIFGGRMPKIARTVAEGMEKAGSNPETIKGFTGLERGAD